MSANEERVLHEMLLTARRQSRECFPPGQRWNTNNSSKNTSRIKVKWAHGEMTVPWPPPQHLSAEVLFQQQEHARSKQRRADTGREDAEQRSSASHANLVEPVTEPVSDYPENKDELIYLIHYCIQETTERSCKMFLFFYPSAGEDIVKTFSAYVIARPKEEKAMSMATLQELFVSCRKKSDDECIAAIPTFFKSQIMKDWRKN